MSRKDKLRCVVCYKRDWHKYNAWETLKDITWQNIDVMFHSVSRVKCECKNCGHIYLSSSMAAFRKLRLTKNTK